MITRPATEREIADGLRELEEARRRMALFLESARRGQAPRRRQAGKRRSPYWWLRD